MLQIAERQAAIRLLCMMIVGMMLEMLGIGFVVPALALMTDISFVDQHPAIASLLARLGATTQTRMVLGGMMFLVALHVFKTAFLGILAWKQARFVFDLQASVSHQLFSGYLRQPYAFHLQRNSSELTGNAINETAQFARGAILASLNILAEALVCVGVGGLLVILEPIGAVIVTFSLGLAAWIFHRATARRVLQWGEARQRHDGRRILHLQQGFAAAKDVKLLGREQEFVRQYAEHNLGSAYMWQRQTALEGLPRLWLELLAVVGLAALVTTMLAQEKTIADIIPTLGVFAAAAFRLLPSMNRVINSIQTIRYSIPTVNLLHKELTLTRALAPIGDAPAGSRLTRDWATIEMQHVHFTYDGAISSSLHDVTLSIARGTSVGFIGGSGAGKSTLIDVILGLHRPTSGQVKVGGIDIRSHMRAWQDQIGYVPQSIYLTDDTLKKNVAFGIAENEINVAAVHRALKAAQLTEFIAELPQGIESNVGERGVRLSGGQRQRIGIARALYHDPDLLVLDEATSALDVETEREVMNAVSALHGAKTILIIAHRLSTVEDCDQIYRLECGKLKTNSQKPMQPLTS